MYSLMNRIPLLSALLSATLLLSCAESEDPVIVAEGDASVSSDVDTA
ncbi:MAG: hypothetical protein AAFV90_13810 [Cyanobacteria bacterium J06634_5]